MYTVMNCVLYVFALLLLPTRIVIEGRDKGIPRNDSFKLTMTKMAVSCLTNNLTRLETRESFINDSLPISRNNMAKLVIGGFRSKPRFIPYIARIISDVKFLCGGTLISRNAILTAGHCVYGRWHYSIYLGSVDMDAPEHGRQTSESHNALLHESYNDDTLANDIAIIFLQDPVNFSPYVSAVNLAEVDSGSLINQKVMVSGWGWTTEGGNPSSVLQYTYLTVVSNKECKGASPNLIDAATICAKSSRETNACRGDSGGPMMARVHLNSYNLQVGITSFAHKNGCTGYPTGYTKVSYYRNWIRRTSGV